MSRVPARPAIAGLVAGLVALGPGAAEGQRALTGRTAQALECAALMFGAAEIGQRHGILSAGEAQRASHAAFFIAERHLGLEQAQIVTVIGKRWARRALQLSDAQFVGYFASTARWCEREFLR